MFIRNERARIRFGFFLLCFVLFRLLFSFQACTRTVIWKCMWNVGGVCSPCIVICMWSAASLGMIPLSCCWGVHVKSVLNLVFLWWRVLWWCFCGGLWSWLYGNVFCGGATSFFCLPYSFSDFLVHMTFSLHHLMGRFCFCFLTFASCRCCGVAAWGMQIWIVQSWKGVGERSRASPRGTTAAALSFASFGSVSWWW